MNKPNFNFNQLSRTYCNRPKEFLNFPRNYPSYARVDSGICDGMNNCHLTDSWAYMNHQPINDIPILNPYVPLRLPIELQTTSNYVLKGTFHHQFSANTFRNQEYLNNFHCINQFQNVELKDRVHPQQQLLQDGLSRLAELNYESTLRNTSIESFDNCATNMNEHEERVKTSIKFQDRNKKLDFKINFRDQNRKLNGCFHLDDSKASNDATSTSVAPPPKKKWIRHYMTGKV